MKYIPVRTQVAARTRKIKMNKRSFDKTAAREKKSALIRQLHPAIFPDIKDCKSMLNKGIFFY
jgi:hypothetical protein